MITYLIIKCFPKIILFEYAILKFIAKMVLVFILGFILLILVALI